MVNFLCPGDTLLVCANGHLTDNKLAVGLLFPCLLTSDIFALPIENVLLVPDYTMEVRTSSPAEPDLLIVPLAGDRARV